MTDGLRWTPEMRMSQALVDSWVHWTAIREPSWGVHPWCGRLYAPFPFRLSNARPWGVSTELGPSSKCSKGLSKAFWKFLVPGHVPGEMLTHASRMPSSSALTTGTAPGELVLKAVRIDCVARLRWGCFLRCHQGPNDRGEDAQRSQLESTWTNWN